MVQSPPTTVMIIRHGEKPDDAGHEPHGVTLEGKQNKDSLIPRGWQRAGALVGLFTGGLARPHVSPPSTLICASYGGSTAHRVFETLQPLSQRLGVPIRPVSPVDEPRHAATAALGSGPQPVLICWEHDHIPHLARSFPVDDGATIPGTWPDARFDLIWVLHLNAAGKYVFSSVNQSLLSEDR